jgi:hypothetical protein
MEFSARRRTIANLIHILEKLSEREKFIKEEMGANKRSLKKVSIKLEGYINGAVDKNPPQHIIWPIPHLEM